MKLRFTLIVAGCGVFDAYAVANTINVPADQPTIQAGINAASNGDTVLVAPGSYVEQINYQGKAVMVRSEQGVDVTAIQVSSITQSVVLFTSGETAASVLQGFTIKFGNSGIVCENGSSPRIIDCKLLENWAYSTSGGTDARGGGVRSISSHPTLINCEIEDNAALNTAVLAGSAQGGGVYVSNGSLTMVGCKVGSNGAVAWTAQGGGIYANNSDVLLINCEITANTVGAGCGPGVGCGSASYGGLRFITSTATLINCTIAGNNASGGQLGTATLANCIVSDATSFNGTVTYSCLQSSYGGDGNIVANPQFVDAANGDYRLQTASPCIDHGILAKLPADTLDVDGDGNTTEPIPLDAGGLRRVVNGFLDMGAYEWQRTCLADISPSSPAVAGDGTINVDDLLTVINAWGECDICVADVNGDNAVNVDDLLAIINGWGTCK